VTVHYGLHAPFCVTATEATEHIYRRSLQSIRRDRADYYILVCVLSGSLGVVYNGRRHSIGRGDFFVVRTNVPYEMHVCPGPEDRYAQICISLPADVAAEFNVDELAGVAIAAEDRATGLAQELVRTLFEYGKSIVAPVATSLLSAILLEVTRMAPRAPSEAKSPRSSMRDVRRDAVLAYLESHCTNPDLRASMVAEACQMSVRYMSALLSEKGLSFSGLVRLRRIQRIRSWLADPALTDETIASLAYRAGFSSVSHGILSFRREYGCTPSKLRVRIHNQNRAVATSRAAER
jgi:AraC-like DNA-binding protein